MRLLVLGAGGKVGRLLQAAWPDQPDVTAIWHGGPASDVQFDILRDGSSLQDALAQADCTLLLAGVTHAQANRPLSDNTTLAQTVLDAAKDRPVFLASSSAVYGRMGGLLREDMPPAPISDYGRSKAMMERVAKDHANGHVLRIGNIAGADALLGVARDHYRLDRFPGGGYPIRSYIGPGLLAHAILRVLRQTPAVPPILNIACPEPVSMADLLSAAGKKWAPQPATPEAIETVSLDTSLLWGQTRPASDAGSIVNDWQETVARL
jgi:nucleoside-diphosphate-sugar epimerase